MTHFTINQEKCNQDGICAAECPTGIIRWTGKGSFPVTVTGGEKFCLNCGHCVAVCPHGAAALKTLSPEDCPSIDRRKLPSHEQIDHLVRARRSIRTFKEQVVEHHKLVQLIDAARFAPTGHNLQQVHWLVIENPEEIQRLAGLVVDWMRTMLDQKPEVAAALAMPQVIAAWERGRDTVCRRAPHLIITHAPKKVASAPTDCVVALTYLELLAYSMGLGTCWAGYFTTAANVFPPLTAALGLPENHRIPGALLIGYPKYQYHRIPKRNEPRITWR